MDGSRTHDGSLRPDTDFEDQEAHRDLTIPVNKDNSDGACLSTQKAKGFGEQTGRAS